MAGKIVADTLEHSTAGIVSTEYVVEGTTKAWGHSNHSANTIQDSFNISSITDDGTGLKDYNWTSSFSSANYAGTSGMGGNEGATSNLRATSVNGVWTSSQAIIKFLQCSGSSLSAVDDPNAFGVFIGDLA